MNERYRKRVFPLIVAKVFSFPPRFGKALFSAIAKALHKKDVSSRKIVVVLPVLPGQISRYPPASFCSWQVEAGKG